MCVLQQAKLVRQRSQRFISIGNAIPTRICYAARCACGLQEGPRATSAHFYAIRWRSTPETMLTCVPV